MSSPQVTKDKQGAPSFDLILLGTGDDGHCASINPGTEEAKAKSGYVLPIPAGSKPGKPQAHPRKIVSSLKTAAQQSFFTLPIVASHISSLHADSHT